MKRRILVIGLALALVGILLGCGCGIQDGATDSESAAAFSAGATNPGQVTVQLLASDGTTGLAGGAVYYYSGGWQPLGTTNSSGTVTGTVPKTTDIEIRYAGGKYKWTTVDPSTNPTLTINTVLVTVKLETCEGTPLTGEAQYYFGGWTSIGNTPATIELLPYSGLGPGQGNYDFKVKYEGRTSPVHTQDVSIDPVVVFRTTKVTLFGSNVLYYNGGWKPFASPKEMIGGTSNKYGDTAWCDFKFGGSHSPTLRLSIDGCSISKVVNTLILKDHNGNPLSGGTARGGFGSSYGTWFVSGSTDANGVLFDIRDVSSPPTNMSYEMRYNGTTQVKTQDVSVNSVFEFQTILLTLRLETCGGTPLDGGHPRFGAGSTYTTAWFPGGLTGSSAPGETAAEFFPGTYSFEMQYKATAEAKVSIVIPNANTTLTWQTTKVTLQYSGAISYGGGTGDSTWFTKPSMELLPGTYKFHFRNAGRMDLTFSGCEFSRSAFALKLIDSGGSGIAGGTGQYYDGGWQNMPGSTGADGLLAYAIPGLKNTLSFRMTHAGASQEKSQNIATNSIVVFQTKLVTFKLLNSISSEITGAGTEYYAGGWKTFGGGNTTTSMELLPLSYSFRVSYAGASQQKSQNIGTDPDVVFQTALVTMKLLDSGSSEIAGAGTQYYAGGWKTFGGGMTKATMELLPVNYSFRVSYAGASQEKSQNVGTNPDVVFQTTLVTFKLLDSGSSEIAGAGTQYYAGGWKTFGSGTTTTTMELLPVNYSFRVSYAGASQEKRQNVGSNSLVQFQTTLVTMKLLDSAGTAELNGGAQYYAGGWKTFGFGMTTTTMELLPVSYSFRVSHGGASKEKSQNVGTNAIVMFQTGQVHSDSGNCTHYYAGGWKAFTQDMQLLPVKYAFRFSDFPETSYTIVAATTNHVH